MKKTLVLILLLLLAITFTATAQQNYKAKFIYAFTRYMNWPDHAKEGFFNIGVFGSFDLYKEISEETMGRTVSGQNVVAINIIKQEQLDITNLHILVIGKKYCTPALLEEISLKFKNSYTLIITEDNGIMNGAGITFINNGPALTFKYSTSNITQKGIAISRQFKGMGEGVN